MGVTGIMAGIVAALPFTTPQYEVRVERDVVYAEARGTLKPPCRYLQGGLFI